MKKFIVILLAAHLSFDVLAADFVTSPPNLQSLAPTTSVSPHTEKDKLIDSILTVTGLKESLQNMPDRVISGTVQSLQKSNAPIETQNQIKQIMEDAYPANVFIHNVTEAMRSNFNEQRFSHLFALVSAPVAKRMVALEAQQPAPQALQSYVLQLATQPLTSKRIAQVKALDKASGASALMVKIYIASIKATAFGAIGDCPDLKAELEIAISKQQKAIETTTQNTIQVMMAYTYRDVSDADLNQYVRINESADSKWIQTIIQKSLEDQFEIGAKKAGHGIGAIIKAKSNQSMFAPKCPGSTTTAAVNAATAKKQVLKVSRIGEDATECLKYDDPSEVRACAEKFR